MFGGENKERKLLQEDWEEEWNERSEIETSTPSVDYNGYDDFKDYLEEVQLGLVFLSQLLKAEYIIIEGDETLHKKINDSYL